MNLGTIVDEGVTQEGFELTPQLVPDNDNNEKIENVNYDNLHEKKKISSSLQTKSTPNLN